MKNVSKHIVNASMPVREAVKFMGEGGKSYCICVDEGGQVVGMFTDGDFRKAVFAGMQLDDPIIAFVNKDFLYVESDYRNEAVAKIFRDTIVQQIPVLENGCPVDVIYREHFREVVRMGQNRKLDNPVVIMAGGKGTRLDPFTRVLPKPLIPLGNDPIIKIIMDEFGEYEINDFYISLNEKSRMIKAYFYDHELPYGIRYLQEDKPLGTVGALKMLEGKVTSPFFVTNCDIIAKANYVSLMDFHLQGGYDLTLVGAMLNYTIPYGVCDVGTKGELKSLREKPNYDFLVNTGLYVLNPEILALIPDDVYFDITDLMNVLISQGNNIGVYPIAEHDWIDVGQWSEYHAAIEKLEMRA